jgi:hypothetical protein
VTTRAIPSRPIQRFDPAGGAGTCRCGAAVGGRSAGESGWQVQDKKKDSRPKNAMAWWGKFFYVNKTGAGLRSISSPTTWPPLRRPCRRSLEETADTLVLVLSNQRARSSPEAIAPANPPPISRPRRGLRLDILLSTAVARNSPRYSFAAI